MPMNARTAAVLALLAGPWSAQAVAQDHIEFQTREDWALGPDRFTDQSAISVSPIPSVPVETLAAVMEALGPGAEVDAYARRDNLVYFSTTETIALPGGAGAAADEDVILWDGTVYGVAWDGSAHGVPPSADLDALHIESTSPLAFAFSLDVSANLAGPGVVGDEDLVRWDGSAFDPALVFDGSARGVPSGANVTGFSIQGPTRWQFSFDIPLALDGATFDDGDAVEYDPVAMKWNPVPYLGAAASGYPAGLDMADFETAGQPASSVRDWMLVR